MSSSPKPSSPPPAYTELDPSQSSSAATPAAAAVAPPATGAPPPPHPGTPARTDSQFPTAPAFPTHAGYGPTNIIQQQTHLLPYYDPRSPYAVAEASSRARWRFFGALCWAMLILAMVSFVTGWEVGVHSQPWNGDYWRRMVYGNADDWSSS